MRINFFEEFPTPENLEKARMIDFPSTIFLAARSLDGFYIYKKELLLINPRVDIAYWPILPRTYWFSPFSYTKDLEDFVEAMKKNKEQITVLLDLELPRKKSIYIRNFINFSKNKKLIEQFLKDAPTHNIKVVTAEYPPTSRLRFYLMRAFGLSYDTRSYKHSSCFMYYTSFFPNKIISKIIMHNILGIKKREPESNIELGLGVIAKGVGYNEKILPPERLTKDLSIMKEKGFEIATIFRLGGLDEEYYKAIRPFV